MSAPIFLLSAGRSGSTLVQRLLNSYEDITLWGEHRGFLKELSDSYFRLMEAPAGANAVFAETSVSALRSSADLLPRKNPANWQAWTNLVSEDDARTVFRDHVRRFFHHPVMGENHHWGFKEIRYGADDRVIEFLARLFPDAIFVFLARHGLDTLSSQFTAFHQGGRWLRTFPSPEQVKVSTAWSRQYHNLLNWHLSGKIRSFWLVFEQFTKKEDAFQPLLSALGKEFGPDQRAVMAMEEGRGSAFQDQTGVDQRWKSLSYPTLLVSDWVMGSVNDRMGYAAPPSIRWFSRIRRLLQGSRPSTGPVPCTVSAHPAQS